MPSPVRVAMWSGPRNISTAMLRAWGNRPDTHATDEPLYAHYLAETGLPHPGRDEVIASQEQDWSRVVEWLTGPVPGDRRIWYQKHMAHHLLPHVGRSWLHGVTNCFLIREPRAMLASLVRIYPEAGLPDTGLPQQAELFETEWKRTGKVPPVLDARDVLENPRGLLSRLCAALGVTFMEEMLTWPPGPRETDGVWAKHWYDAVERSTGFEPYRPKEEALPEHLSRLVAECDTLYSRLWAHRLTA